MVALLTLLRQSGFRIKRRRMPGVKGRSGGARKGAGRKTFKPTAEQRNIVEMGSAFGLSQEQLCLLVIDPRSGKPICEQVLRAHFREEIDRGHPKALLTVGGALYGNAVKHNNVTAQIFYLKTRGKWTEAPLNVALTGPNGGPIQVQQITSRVIDADYTDITDAVSESVSESIEAPVGNEAERGARADNPARFLTAVRTKAI